MTTPFSFRKLLSAINIFPKQRDFHIYFQRGCENLVAGADILRRMVTDPQGRDNLCKLLEEHEHIGDRITKEVIELLHKTFLTPIDREDIHRLVTRLDDVMDFMYSSGSRMTIYQLEQTPPELAHLAEIIHRSTLEMLKAVAGLRTLSRPAAITASCVEVSCLENEADETMNKAIGELFRTDRSFQHLIQVKELLEGMERTTDRCKDVTEIIQGIVVKHA